MSQDTYLKRQLNRYKDLLANFSRKNREIFYKESKASTINLSKTPFTKSMLQREDDFRFVPLRAMDPMFVELMTAEELDLTNHFQIDEMKDRDAVNRIMKRLDKIRLADERHQKEFGISGAWVLGPFLCWRSSVQAPKEDLLITPIFKIPIDLKRNKKKKMVLETEEDSFTMNPSLVLAFKQFLGVIIPEGTEFESPKEGIDFLNAKLVESQRTLEIPEVQPDSVPKLYGKVKVVKDAEGNTQRIPVVLDEVLTASEKEIYQRVTATNFMLIDVVYIDQLNASRMALFNDYDGIIESGLDHPILNELFNGTPIKNEGAEDREKLRELDSYKERENHFVVDIDSTQHRAIDKATKSKAIVIQGPPGTGKSQTIVNLIADYLSKGKKVLFVSEKRPALDVVFNRMKSAGIESQSVLIHSSDLNKTELYQSFLELANTKPNRSDEKEWSNSANGLDKVKSEINKYAELIQTRHQSSELSYSDLMVNSVHSKKELYQSKVFKKFQNSSYEDLKNFSKELAEVQALLRENKNLSDSPWIKRTKNTVNSVSLVHELSDLIEEIEKSLLEITSLDQKYTEIAQEKITLERKNSILSCLPANAVGVNSKSVWEMPGIGIREKVDKLKSEISAAMDEINSHKESYFCIAKGAKPELIERLEKYYAETRGIGDWFSREFWDMKKMRALVCPKWTGGNSQFLGYRAYRIAHAKVSEIVKIIDSGKNLSLEVHEESVKSLSDCFLFLTTLEGNLNQIKDKLPEAFFKTASASFEGFNLCVDNLKCAQAMLREIDRIKALVVPFSEKLKPRLKELPELRTLGDLHAFSKLLLESVRELEAIDKFDIVTSKIAGNHSVENLREFILTELVKSDVDWQDMIESTCTFGWLDEIFSSSDLLRTFDSARKSDQVNDLKGAFDRHQKSARQAVLNAFAKRWAAEEKNEAALGLLKKESTKQKKVLSPREVMEKGALKTMLDLKPCWLMSPLSISQMLPLKMGLFDVIIFDEASQVRVEDAIPSIFRASTMIVVGDPKQMPPTNFFAGGAIADDDEDEEEEIAESILDLAMRIFPEVLLEWHYRSRSESLIAFSNRAFYGGRLIAAPNPQLLTASGAMKFQKVRNAYFDGKLGNSVEADAVVDRLVELLKVNSDRSFGIISMGMAQANALDEAIDRRMNIDPAARSLLENAMAFKDGDADASLFNKSLENVQGDERDVILVSVGYAPSEEGKKLRMNFGPLGNKGGGRRLNVAITRAKSEIHVFTSFAPAEIKTDEEALSHNPNMCLFGRYLKFVEAISENKSEVAKSILDSFPMSGVLTDRKSSRFALDVKRRLEALGYSVTAEIGANGFYIDLGIHHPSIPSNFILGIECDGAVFHSTPYARDRDKIREQLLTSRGWKIARVWSQDWSKNWNGEVQKLDGLIKSLIGSAQHSGDEKKSG